MVTFRNEILLDTSVRILFLLFSYMELYFLTLTSRGKKKIWICFALFFLLFTLYIMTLINKKLYEMPQDFGFGLIAGEFGTSGTSNDL